MQLGLFLGFSERHSSQVPLIPNVETGKISPQYHVIFDNKFKTVHSLPDNKALEKQWTMIVRLGHEYFLDVDFDNNGNPIVSTMSELIKAYSKEKQKRLIGEDITAIGREECSTNNQIYNHNESQAENPLPLQSEIPPPLAKDTQVPGGDFPIQQDADLDEVLEGDLQQQALLDQAECWDVQRWTSQNLQTTNRLQRI